MRAINYTYLRDNMKEILDAVNDDYETMVVTRKNGRNVVVLSEEVYNNLMENLYIRENHSNYEWLLESKNQLEHGKVKRCELIDPDEKNKKETGDGEDE